MPGTALPRITTTGDQSFTEEGGGARKVRGKNEEGVGKYEERRKADAT